MNFSNTSISIAACPYVWDVGGRNISAFCCSAKDNKSDTFYLDFGYDPTLAAIIGSVVAILVWVISVLLYLVCNYGSCFCCENQVAPQPSVANSVLHGLDDPVWWEKRRIFFDIFRLCATFFAAICLFPIPSFNLNIPAKVAIIPHVVLDFSFFIAFKVWQREGGFLKKELKPIKYYVASYIVLTGFPIGFTVKFLVASYYDDPASVPLFALFLPHGILFYLMPLYALVFYMMFIACPDLDRPYECECSCSCFWGILVLLAVWVLSMVGITYYVWPQSLPYVAYMEYLAPCTLSQALAPLWLLLLCSLVVTHCYFFSSIKKGGEAKSAALHLTPDLLHLYGVCCTAVILTFYYDQHLQPAPDIDQYLKPFWPLLLADLLGITGVFIRLCSHCCSTPTFCTRARQQSATVSAAPRPTNNGPLPRQMLVSFFRSNCWGQNQRAFPDTWEEHPPDQSRFFVPKVDPQTPEYREIETGFLQSIYTQDGPIWKVHNISRVQNTALYEQYSVAKRNMDKGLPNRINERTLWHGTADGAIGNINENGFNRTYRGKNATFFGEGVYFAVSASYSAQDKYAVPDGNSNRFMYRARVLVGEYTQGDQNMKEPPIKPNSGRYSRYDSVVDNMTNPTMFVVFRDAYAYPEYLIEFSIYS
ncbi:uncharacterized protein LOC144913448 [Branchiostoma floridae x Branchiostoma belcheri]